MVEIRNYEVKIEKYEALEGGLIVKDVKIMAEGTWHASNAWNPMRYSSEVLKKYSDNWSSNSLWNTHSSDRRTNDKIGEIRNPHYADHACVADIFLHGLTPESQSNIQLITSKQIDSISAEIAVLRLEECPKLEIDNAIEIEFVGAALVDKGACDICKLNKENSNHPIGDQNMAEDMSKKLEELEASIATLTEKFASIEIPEAVDIKPTTEGLAEVTAKLAEAEKTIATYGEKIEALEATGIQHLSNGDGKTDVVKNPFE